MGNEVLLEQEEEDSWDFFWKSTSQDFDRECRADPDFACLAGKKFKVWDGNYRVIVWLEVSREEKFRNSFLHHPRVRCVLVSPPPDALKEMEVAMHNLNITSHAAVQYDWIQDAERTLQVLSTPLSEYKVLLSDKVYSELEESRKKTATKGWYSDNMTVAAGAYIMSFSEVMAAQKELVSMEKDMEANVRASFHHPSGNDLDNDIRPWLHQWAMWAMLETYCLNMLSSCVAIQGGVVTEEMAAEEEDKFIKHFDAYRQQFWKIVWNSGKNDRHLIIDRRRAKQLFFRYAVWVRVFEILPACFSLWRKAPIDPHSMYSNDDAFTRSWDDMADWERANCPFYLEQTEDPPAMFHDWEGHCFERLQELKQSEAALKAASGDPNSIPTLTTDLKLADEKLLPHVYDPRKLQNLSDDECLEQAKALEPRADQVVTTFTKLKRKEEELTPKTSIVEIQPEQAEEIPPTTDGLTDSTPAPRRSTRKPRKKKDEDDEPSTEQRQEPSTTATTGPVEVEVEVEVNDVPVVQPDQPEPTQEIRNPKRLKKKPAESKDFANGEFREDLQFEMEDKWVVVRANLLEVIVSLKSKKQGGRTRVTVPALEAISGICKRLKLAGRRPRPFTVNKKKSETRGGPHNVLDDNGFVILFHGGSLQSSQQIADTLDAMEGEWKHFLSYDICNETPTFVPNMKLSHNYSKAEVIVRAFKDPVLPKQEYWPFDKTNSGRDTLTLFNFNSKMEDSRSGEGKCVGFLQTLIENFSETGDVVLDLNAHKGESLYAASNCGRVIVGLTEDIQSCEGVIARLIARENKTPVRQPTAERQETSSRKKPLDEDDDLGEIFDDLE
ncbi:hypothetical protein R1sor_019652 [Riccia sorocarpa]|uniref:Uncharacterized protein n=1 Tax=Riccia sorocarpa TaxID=122646 RepID=A0ABD3IGX8_9MARC